MASLKNVSTAFTTVSGYEGFRSTPYQDVNGLAIGYGTHTMPGTNRPVQAGDTLSQADAQALWPQSAQQYVDRAAGQVGGNWDNLSESQQNALLSVTYNYGSLPSDVAAAARTGDSALISNAILAHQNDGPYNADGTPVNAGRRASEAEMVRNDSAVPSGRTASGQGFVDVSTDPTVDTSIPQSLQDQGYNQSFKYTDPSTGQTQTYYLSADGKTSVGYNTDTGKYETYNADTGAVTNADYTPPAGTDLSSLQQASAPISAAGSAVGGTPAAGALSAANGMNIGGAGCLSAALSPAGLLAGLGLTGALGGLASNALMSAGMAALSGGGIQGIMGAALGSAAGALGNSLGAALGGGIGAMAGQALGGAIGAIVSGQNPMQALSGAAFGALSQMGSSLIPGLSNVMPAGLAQAAIGGLTGVLGAVAKGAPAGAAAQFALAGGLGGALNGVVSNMTGNYTLGSTLGAVATGALNGTLPALYSNAPTNGQINLSKFINNIQAAAALSANNKNMVGAISEAMSTGFGNSASGGYGAKTRNMSDALTFSVTTLGNNITAVSADMIAMGAWDTSNLMRLMQPGNIAAQILMKGLGDYVGLTNALVALNVPVAGIDNPIYDNLTQIALNSITDIDNINTVRTAFNMTTPLTNLGELTQLEKMMPTSFTYLPFHNFREFGVHLATIGINTSSTVKDMGTAFSTLETASDLNHVSQMDQPITPEAGQQLMQIYGYGGGVFGEQTMADMLGTAAGYVHTDTIPVIVQTTKMITNHSEAATLKNLTTLLNDTLKGAYTNTGNPGQPDADPPVPEDLGSIDIPGVGSFSSLDDAVLAFIPLIEAEHVKLLNTTDPVLKDALNKLDVAYNASCAQLVRENNNLKIHNVDLFAPIPVSPVSTMMFVQSLDYYGLQTGYGQPAEFLEQVASNDIYGDSIKYCMRQARNADRLKQLGIDTDQYKLPRSQYYRDPEGFYQNMYLGQMPVSPQNQFAAVWPRTPQDVYITSRNDMLSTLGYDQANIPNHQKDEIYYDSAWANSSPSVNESIGRSLVKTAVDRNIQISPNNDLLIVDLLGATTVIGQIKSNGLVLNNNEFFTTTMMQIVNRLLYGNIQTTKFTNPFNTDQMIFGLLELLAQVTDQNVDALMQTVTGGMIANGLLSQLIARFGNARSLYDTGMNRNDPAAWGGSGPDAVPDPNAQPL